MITPFAEFTVATAVFELDHEAVPVLFEDGAVAVKAPSPKERLPSENAPNVGVARDTVNTAVVEPDV